MGLTLLGLGLEGLGLSFDGAADLIWWKVPTFLGEAYSCWAPAWLDRFSAIWAEPSVFGFFLP